MLDKEKMIGEMNIVGRCIVETLTNVGGERKLLRYSCDLLWELKTKYFRNRDILYHLKNVSNILQFKFLFSSFSFDVANHWARAVKNKRNNFITVKIFYNQIKKKENKKNFIFINQIV